jgi:hypothetical protein
MSYKIQYEKFLKQELLGIKSRKIPYPIVKWSVISIIAVTAAILCRLGMFDFLIPGNKEVTKDAFQTMVEGVQEGNSVKDAVVAFCEEILAGAEYPG